MSEIVSKVFDLCVKLLVKIAELTGTTYEFVNVIIFCVLGPLAFLILLFMYYHAKRNAERFKYLYKKFVDEGMRNPS